MQTAPYSPELEPDFVLTGWLDVPALIDEIVHLAMLDALLRMVCLLGPYAKRKAAKEALMF
jgi:hypothetical protein